MTGHGRRTVGDGHKIGKKGKGEGVHDQASEKYGSFCLILVLDARVPTYLTYLGTSKGTSGGTPFFCTLLYVRYSY